MDAAKHKNSKYSGMWAVPIACVLSLLLTSLLPVFEVTDKWLNDIQVSYLNPDVEPSKEIVIVTIKDSDLEQFPYSSPIDRAFLTDIVETLKARDVKALFLDILFDQPTEPEKDQMLKKALDDFGKPLVFSYGTTFAGLNENQVAYQAAFVAPEDRALPNLVKSTFDDTARWVLLGDDVEGQGYIESVPMRLASKLGYENLPTSEVPIRWRGNYKTKGVPFKVYPVKTLKLLPKQWFENKVVFLGVDFSLHDRHRTPYSVALGEEGTIPGIFILAHIFAQLTEGHEYPSPAIEQGVNLLVMFLAALLATVPILFVTGGMSARVAAFIVLFAVVSLCIFWSYQYFAVYMSFTKISLAFGFSVLIMEFWRRRQEEKQKRFVHDAFGMFVDKEYVDMLIEDPSKISLTGDRKHMAYIFTDVADFTTFSEKNDAVTVADSLNQYLSECSDVIFEHKGTIVDFIGDAIFVVFNAPIDQDDYERKTVECALAIAKKSEEFRLRPEMQEIGFGHTRVGVHCGISIIGNMGSKDRMKFSALGDTINTTARLEGLNKYLGTRVMMSEDIAHCYDHKRLLGRFVVKGKVESLGVYEPLHDSHPVAPYLQDYEAAYALMAARECEKALKAFETLLESHPDDTVVAFHIKRLHDGACDDIVKMSDK